MRSITKYVCMACVRECVCVCVCVHIYVCACVCILITHSYYTEADTVIIQKELYRRMYMEVKLSVTSRVTRKPPSEKVKNFDLEHFSYNIQ